MLSLSIGYGAWRQAWQGNTAPNTGRVALPQLRADHKPSSCAQSICGTPNHVKHLRGVEGISFDLLTY